MAFLIQSHCPAIKRGRNAALGIWFVLFAFLAGTSNSPAQSTAKEYQVKAIFLFNFAQFVKWPSNAFPESQTPLVIGVLGEDPFGSYLDDAVRGETVNARPLVVQRYRGVGDIKTC